MKQQRRLAFYRNMIYFKFISFLQSGQNRSSDNSPWFLSQFQLIDFITVNRFVEIISLNIATGELFQMVTLIFLFYTFNGHLEPQPVQKADKYYRQRSPFSSLRFFRYPAYSLSRICLLEKLMDTGRKRTSLVPGYGARLVTQMLVKQRLIPGGIEIFHIHIFNIQHNAGFIEYTVYTILPGIDSFKIFTV